MIILLLQFLWLSFFIIGLATYVLFSNKKFISQKSCSLINQFHFLSKFFIFLLIGFATLCPIVIASFLFKLSITWTIIYYLIALASSVYFIITKKLLPEHNWLGLFKNKSQLPILILIILLLVNYLLNLKLGGMLFGDERFEIAQINLFIAKGPTLLDPIFGVHGVPPATYSLNILHIVEASFSKILNVPAVWTWFYSHAFCNFIIWLGLFSTFIEILECSDILHFRHIF